MLSTYVYREPQAMYPVCKVTSHNIIVLAYAVIVYPMLYNNVLVEISVHNYVIVDALHSIQTS
jgi:hypothetical protein